MSPLKDTADLAADAAVQANAWNVTTARNVTVWNILQIQVPTSSAFQLVQTGSLARHVPGLGWFLKGVLDYSEFTHCWSEFSLAPMGVEAWAKTYLMPTFRTIPDHACDQCHKKGAVWRMHCAECWITYLEDQQK